MLKCLDGFAGIQKGGFFGGMGAWIDQKKAPGDTSQADFLGWRSTLKSTVTLEFFFWSPNLIWFVIACLVYVVFPYDIESAKAGFAWGWVTRRLAFNFCLCFSYYGFFYWALYLMAWAKRKFQPGVMPTAGNMAHNYWYFSLGVLQWTLYECGMTRLWATGWTPYVSNAEILTSPKLLALNVLWVLLVPLWRDLHFYIAHRFLHIRAVYKYVHSLHHRSTDPEPFSGMTMHPVEHLFYFSNCLTPSLYLSLSPLIFLWNFMHLTLAPGAGHSGFEDHWQADQYHYTHHAKFECNYGSPSSAWIDQFFGTFREKLGASEMYKGEFQDDKKDDDKKAKVWSAQSYLGLQSRDHALYTCACLFITAVLLKSALSSPIDTTSASVVAALVSHGPVAAALVIAAAYDKMNWRWPFQKERIIGAFGFFAVCGWFACLLPVYHFVQRLCSAF
jgi:sterol desaturase/sphingolipid hydroxylase (fatty acid hydroxylase superfamily)